MTVIETDQLTKRFNDVIAVNDLSLHVEKGEIYGFLGLNGAGKTTTIRLLLGMIRADKGSLSLFGLKISTNTDIWNQIGYLVETPHAYPELTVRENLELICRLRGLSDKDLIPAIIEKLHLTPYRDRQARYLSMGNNQRLGLAKALMHTPQLLILDEPINGLDPSGIVEIRALFSELVDRQHTTIFLSSHILSEISKIATRIGIVHEGRLIKELSSGEFHDQILKKVEIDTVDNNKALNILQAKGITALINDRHKLEITEQRIIRQPETIATLLVHEKVPPKMLIVVEEDLEAFFLRIIGEDKKSHEPADTDIPG